MEYIIGVPWRKEKMMRILMSLVIISMLVLTCAYGEETKESVTEKENCGAKIDTSDMRYEKSPLNKLGRGVINTVTCLAETPAGIYRVSKDKGEVVGVTLGFVEGLVTSFLRGASGIFDMVTFIIPPYDRPLMQPEYALDSFEKSYHELDKATSAAPEI